MVDFQVGGPVDIASVAPNGIDNCRGFTSYAPSFSVNYTSDAAEILRFYYVGDGDTTLIIHTADGNWACRDDFPGTWHPLIDFSNPPSGRYDIWVGSQFPNATLSGTLYVTENPDHDPATAEAFDTQVIPLDFVSFPWYGETALTSGSFESDPVTVEATVGGNVDVAALGMEGCIGFPTMERTYSISYEAGSAQLLRFYFVGDGNTTLLIYAADGNWHCSSNSTMDFTSPLSGSYDIWIGTTAPNAPVSGTLYITEDTNNHP
jgi:hypothetical protein